MLQQIKLEGNYFLLCDKDLTTTMLSWDDLEVNNVRGFYYTTLSWVIFVKSKMAREVYADEQNRLQFTGKYKQLE